MAKNIALLVGSLRKESISRKVAHALTAFAPDLAFTEVAIGNLPLYNQDLEVVPPPAEWGAFRDQLRAADGYLFVTPEYNRTIPGALKNAIDVGSRPYGHSAFGGNKPAAVVSVSPGQIGGFGANHHLRQSLVFLDLIVLAQPEMYVNNAAKLVDAAGQVADEGARALLTKFGKAFTALIDRHAA